jgi:hypothetical protein
MSWDNTAQVQRRLARAQTSKSHRSPTTPSAPRPTPTMATLNFGKGLISNRLDLLSELEFRYQARNSAAADQRRCVVRRRL